MLWIGNYSKVAEVLFNKLILVIFFLTIHVEFFFSMCCSPAITLSKILRIKKIEQNKHNALNFNLNSIVITLSFISIIFFKFSTSHIFGLLLVVTVVIFKVNQALEKITSPNTHNSTIFLILPSIAIFLYLLFFIKSFLGLFFFIELYGVIYYFCFLTSYSFTNHTILKYKNGLLLLLWNNFLTTFFLGLGCFVLLRNAGSTDFYELSFLKTNFLGFYVFLVGLFWKLGLPIFHFFKLEVYRYLLRENVFIFSIVTILVNVTILMLCFMQPVFFSAIYAQNCLVILISTAIILAITNLTVVNFLQFFALSSVLTLSTVLSVLLV